ncbi:MAG: acyl-CoA/acyl-ACP dehydrogenase [Deltaproteobacteria bacterium]|nr:acyl-CoA/acyl-ACP dehydrogenase [Deltaproteobacteria bacterium]
MDFNFTEEQKILKETARAFLESYCSGGFVLEMEKDEIGYTPELWRRMAELGWQALIVPEKYGGVGGNLLDLVVMLEEMGRACLPGPFFSTVALGCLSLLEAANPDQLQRFLPAIASGKSIWTMAHLEPGTTRYDPFFIQVTAHGHGDGYVLNGAKIFVPDAHVADYMICVARTSGRSASRDGITLFAVDCKAPGIHVTPLNTIAGDKQFEVMFDRVTVPMVNRLGPQDQGGVYLEKILQKCAVCKCAEMVGGAQRVLDMSTAYAKEREQFGRPIGSFQAVQHHCSNMLIGIEGSRYLTCKAAWMLKENIPCGKQAAAAKAWVSGTYKEVVRLGHQVLGATGYMIEHDMPLFSRRAKMAEMALGDGRYHREIVARMSGL